jgi:hypothetical protein
MAAETLLIYQSVRGPRAHEAVHRETMILRPVGVVSQFPTVDQEPHSGRKHTHHPVGEPTRTEGVINLSTY